MFLKLQHCHLIMASAQTSFTEVKDIVVGVLTANPDSTLDCFLFPSI